MPRRSPSHGWWTVRIAAILLLVSALPLLAANAPDEEKRVPDEAVTFPGFGGLASLDGFVWLPPQRPPYPAVVAMHGCGGVFFDQPLDFDHIAGKFRYWGKQLSELGFLVLLVDGFTPRGIGHEGVCSIPLEDRPPEVNATLARPFDAHAGLDYVRSRPDVIGDRIGLLGWSNGGTAVLSTVASAPQAPLLQPDIEIFTDPSNPELMRLEGFSATVALYPGCGFDGGHYNGLFEVYSATRIFMGAADTTVDPMTCRTRADEAQMAGSELEYLEYPGMEHGYEYSEWQSAAARETRLSTLDHFARGISAIFSDGFEQGTAETWSSFAP